MIEDFNEKCESFMYIYMYELEKELKLCQDELKKVSYHADEANTDRPLKEYLKEFVLNKFNRLNSCISDNRMEFSNEFSINHRGIILSYLEFGDIYIEKVYLPDELTAELRKEIAMSKTSVYTNPDLLFQLTNGAETKYVSIELKSTKNNSIPGSSIQQVNPKEWVIFVKHTKNSVDIVTGQYINSINSKLQFPDRSPRPQVAFDELKEWNDKNRYQVGSKTIYNIEARDEEAKYELLNDWQNHLANRWMEIIFTNVSKINEPWFNNNLRKFILKFIDKYDTLTVSERQAFRSMIEKLIKE